MLILGKPALFWAFLGLRVELNHNKPMKSKLIGGFTLIEIMIVIVIAAVITTVGTISIASRWQASRLESAAEEMVSAISSARTSALYKNCPTRIIFCADQACFQRDVTVGTDDSGDYIEVNGAPARFYAVLRLAYYGSDNEDRPCYFQGTDPNEASGTNNLISGWDFESKPISIPNEVRVEASLYGASELEQMNESEWDVAPTSAESGTSSAEAINSLWFPTSSSGLPASANMEPSIPANVPVQNKNLTDNRVALVQLKLRSCNPRQDEDCLAFIIAAGPGGEIEAVRCEAGAGRANDTNTCFGN